MSKIIQSDSLVYLRDYHREVVDLIFIDPPFNTGNTQKIHGRSYNDDYNENFVEWLMNHIEVAYTWLSETGSLFVLLDWREVHYVKVALDTLFGRDNFCNEIIWSFDYGGRPKRLWPRKHNTILWYSKTNDYTFNFDAIDRIPYMAPTLVGPEKAARGKTPTDVWWNSIVHTTGAERLDYPTQKPLSILERIVLTHSNRGDKVIDFFAGSGTTGEAAGKNGRKFIMVDENFDAIKIMRKRLAQYL